jgi:hypothetical protein
MSLIVEFHKVTLVLNHRIASGGLISVLTLSVQNWRAISPMNSTDIELLNKFGDDIFEGLMLGFMIGSCTHGIAKNTLNSEKDRLDCP